MIPTQDVDQNVYKIQIVIDHEHVSIINVKIHVLEFVELMLNVEYKTTHPHAFAYPAILVIHHGYVNK